MGQVSELRDAEVLAALIELAIGRGFCPTLAEIDRRFFGDALFVVDLSNDPSYTEVLYEMFGPRVIFLHIGRSGNGMNFERRTIKGGVLLVYTIGRTELLDLLLYDMHARWH